jgi:hypothetical protein
MGWVVTSFLSLTKPHAYVDVHRFLPHRSSLARRERKEEEYDPSSATTSIGRGKGSNDNNNHKSTHASKPSKSKNTAVVVANLPHDTEINKLVERFDKCGAMKEGDEGEPKLIHVLKPTRVH